MAEPRLDIRRGIFQNSQNFEKRKWGPPLICTITFPSVDLAVYFTCINLEIGNEGRGRWGGYWG